MDPSLNNRCDLPVRILPRRATYWDTL